MRQVKWDSLNQDEKAACLSRPFMDQDESVQSDVADILRQVRMRGDEAARTYTARFDGAVIDDVRACTSAVEDLDPDICAAIDMAYANIYAFHAQQGFDDYSTVISDGITCQRAVRPIARAGLYVPGGSAPLVSTTLMLGIPAQIAGCAQVILCTPCDNTGAVNPYILYAARKCGITDIFRVGGAQAIAAMAYGTNSIPKVDKIYGPGNAYVTEAKMQVARDASGAAIDMPAGPSEVCVIADESTNPVFAAADLLSQAEHDPLSQCILITTSHELSEAILAQVKAQLSSLPRRVIAEQALSRSLAIQARDMDQAMEIANAYAAEHLILCFDDAPSYVPRVQHAGSVFVGQWSPESAGDYASGTNHVLPTYGYARSYSGLSVEAFQRTMTVQSITPNGLRALGPTVETLARLEGLEAHARAVSVRLAEDM